MQEERIKFKGNKDGLNIIININKFSNIDEVIEGLLKKLSYSKRFYKGAVIKITTDVKQIDDRDLRKIKDVLFDELLIRDCIFEDTQERSKKLFNGVTEGKTKFVTKTIRSGQKYEYSGNLVIIGDINPGAEVYAAGNIIVLGAIKGNVYAGNNGNEKAIIAAFTLIPQIMKIADVITRSPEDMEKPIYPELAKIKNGRIVVEPYLINKYI